MTQIEKIKRSAYWMLIAEFGPYSADIYPWALVDAVHALRRKLRHREPWRATLAIASGIWAWQEGMDADAMHRVHPDCIAGRAMVAISNALAHCAKDWGDAVESGEEE